MYQKLLEKIVVGIFVAMLLAIPTYAVENVKISSYGAGVQIWFEAEDFDERNPADETYFALGDEAGAFGRSINTIDVGGDGSGYIRYTFNISLAGGSGGTWYFWGRVINPSNQSSFMLVDGHPGDQTPVTTLPVSGLVNGQRVFEDNRGSTGNWEWGTPSHEEAHTKTLRDGENTMWILNRQTGNIWDVFMWTNDPDYVPTDADYQNAQPPALGKANKPFPANEATDLPREVVLSWEPGKYAPATNGHRIYLGTVFNDVNDGTAGVAQDASSYTPPQRLEFDTTYYWRVDEVNAPPDSTVHKGNVWSFTTEPVGYPVDGATITASASSSAGPDFGPENTINGSGLNAADQHSTEPTDMWLSGDEPAGAWIQYEFDKVQSLHQMLVWNGNQAFEALFGFGFKAVTVEYSTDGATWTALANVPEFARGSAASDYTANTTVDFGGAAAKYVKLTASSNWGGILPQYNLSEVRFSSVPVAAREPFPAPGATDVDVETALSWRAGREAVSHDVSLSTDEQAVIDSNAIVANVSGTTYSSALDLASTYYWRIDEVNEAETPITWEGDVWSFSTLEYLTVDDFESYNDIDPPDPESNRIFDTWKDGYEVPTNGALVGNDPPQPSYAETVVIHGGAQSMPLFYSNTGGAVSSEATRTLAVPQDWTKHGIQALELYFRGAPGNTGQLYVKINGVKVPYDGDASSLEFLVWRPWSIDLTASGLSLQSVSTLAIGIDGNGATGTLYIDDIRLSRSAAAPGEAGLVAAFAFGSRQLDCATYNDPTVNYTIVHHTSPEAIQYDAGKGYGYEVLYMTSSPYGARAGYGVFGPFDDSPNGRDNFGDECPEELYDSFIGAKEFKNAVNETTMGGRDIPSPNPEGIIFRVDVPNGLYRFVAAVGEADNPHAHRLLAEDGGSGPPESIGTNYVVLVHNHDQAQQTIGEADAGEPGQGVFARVGFDGKIPPLGDGISPDPQFVDMDENGMPTSTGASSPILEVTQGYIRIHQLQGNSNDGPGGAADVNGGDIVILELWKVGP